LRVDNERGPPFLAKGPPILAIGSIWRKERASRPWRLPLAWIKRGASEICYGTYASTADADRRRGSGEYFSIVNLRVMATPSSALDVYNDFFSTHPITCFCQINSVKLFLACPYGELGVEMSRDYTAGNFNASLFASEGIASVGVWLSPPAALVGSGRDCSGKSTIFGTVFQICSYVRGFFRNCR
jgi:hypothetical protein